MTQDMVSRDGLEFRIDLQPRQVLYDWSVEIEFSFFFQLHQRKRNKRL